MKIELAHDSLAAKIYDKVSLDEKTLRKVEKFIKDRYAFFLSRDVLLTKDDLEYVNPYLGQVDISTEERQFVNKSQAAVKRRQRIIGLIVGAVFIAISGLAIYSLIQRGIAVDQAEIALANEKSANESKLEAEKQAQIAEGERQKAINEREEALRQTEIARTARQSAEEQRILALNRETEAKLARIVAEKATLRADSARQNAEDAQYAEAKQREEAIKARNEAEENEKEALKLLRLSVAQSMAARSLQLNDPHLKARIAQQAYNFNTSYEGDPYDGTIYEGLYDAAKKLKGNSFNQLKGHKSAVRSMVFDRKGGRLFTTGSDGKLLRWTWNNSIVEGKQNPVEVNRFIKRSLSISPDGSWMAAGRDRKPYLQLFNLDKPELAPLPIDDYASAVLDLVFSPNGTGFLILGADQSISRYNMKNSTVEKILDCDKPMQSVSLSPNGKEIAGISKEGEFFLWDDTGKRLNNPGNAEDYSRYRFYSVAYNKKGDRLALGTREGVVLIMNRSNDSKVAELPGHSARISDLIFSKQGDYLATASYDGTVQLWLSEGEKYEKRLPIILRDHDSWVMSLAFSPDGQNLITGGRDGQIKIWPTDPNNLASVMCTELDKNFTSQEWSLYVGDDIDIEKTCENLPLPE